MKSIKDFTLGEVSSTCKQTDIAHCPECSLHPWCDLWRGTVPEDWDFDEYEDSGEVETANNEVEAQERESDKPRLCEVLGVDVNEEFTFSSANRRYECAKVNEDGLLVTKGAGNYWNLIGCDGICYLINHPDCMERKPRLTERELAICDNLGANYVTKNANGGDVWLWDGKPVNDCGVYKSGAPLRSGINRFISIVKEDLFPSIHPGDCVQIVQDNE